MMSVVIPSRLSDGDLVAEVARLATCEREATTSLIAHLAELYGRRLHERAGYSSLFTYCRDVLRLSEHEAYDRMRAAKVAGRYPRVLDLLAIGRMNLRTVRLLAPHLTRRNHEELFAAASGKRKRQVQELLARRFAQADVAPSIRRLPRQAIAPALETSAPLLAVSTSETPVPPPIVASAPEVAARSSMPAPPRPLVLPLSPDRYRITFTASGETCEMLELAQDLLRHAIPNGDAARIVARALEVLVEDLVRKKFAATSRPRGNHGQEDDSRNIPAEVRRVVYIRDRGRCAFIGSDGHRCGERTFVEFHHLVPYAAGGKPTVDNIALRCHAHNSYEAESFHGPARRYVSAEVAIEGALSDRRVTGDAFRSGTKAGSLTAWGGPMR
jgi:hypothetical protein